MSALINFAKLLIFLGAAIEANMRNLDMNGAHKITALGYRGYWRGNVTVFVLSHASDEQTAKEAERLVKYVFAPVFRALYDRLQRKRNS